MLCERHGEVIGVHINEATAPAGGDPQQCWTPVNDEGVCPRCLLLTALEAGKFVTEFQHTFSKMAPAISEWIGIVKKANLIPELLPTDHIIKVLHFPPALFVLGHSDEPVHPTQDGVIEVNLALHQYVHLNLLPKDLQDQVRRALKLTVQPSKGT